MSQQIRSFVEEDEAPVYCTFGSLQQSMPEWSMDLFVEALRQAGCRAIVQSRSERFPVESRQGRCYFVGRHPHQPVFERCWAVVHHGGAGTTHAATRAGCPSIVVPFMDEQLYWGQRLHRLRIAPPPLPAKRATPEQLAQRIRAALDSRAMQQQARDFRRQMLGRNGVEAAVLKIEAMLRTRPDDRRTVGLNLPAMSFLKIERPTTQSRAGHSLFAVKSNGFTALSMDKIDEEDRLFFRRSMADVTPLKTETAAFLPKKPPPRRLRNNIRDAADAPSDFPVSEAVELEVSQGGDVLRFSQPGVQPRWLLRLRRGELPVEAELDLHGATVEETRHRLGAFLTKAGGRGLRCVRIIHGKGYRSTQTPVLKNKLNLWLRQIPQVLAFCSAPPGGGGTGAVLVLLKRPMSEKS